MWGAGGERGVLACVRGAGRWAVVYGNQEIPKTKVRQNNSFNFFEPNLPLCRMEMSFLVLSLFFFSGCQNNKTEKNCVKFIGTSGIRVIK